MKMADQITFQMTKKTQKVWAQLSLQKLTDRMQRPT